MSWMSLIMWFQRYVNIYHRETYYNMMTIMNNIRTMNITLSMLGFGGLCIAVFYSLYNEIVTSIGYMTASILSSILVCAINKIHVVMNFQPIIGKSKLENDELTMTNRIKKKKKIWQC